jgi:hypothetical protein
MSVFEAAYPVGHPDPDYSAPGELGRVIASWWSSENFLDITTNLDSAAKERHGDAVEISDSLMKNRFSCRWYLPKPVDKKIIEEIIDAARCSPSGNNMQ